MHQAANAFRHPEFSSIKKGWAPVTGSINLNDVSSISEVPGVPTYQEIKSAGTFDAEGQSICREIALASALRTFAKAMEALEAFDFSRSRGATASSIMLSYSVSFFAARSFCMLCGFAPYHRDLHVTVDVLFEPSATEAIELEDVIRYYHMTRWGHEETWALTARLIRTFKKDTITDSYIIPLRKDKLSKVSAVRNKQYYADTELYSGDIASEADFPSLNLGPSFVIVKRYRAIAYNLANLCVLIIDGVGLKSQFAQTCHASRLALIDSL